jgi:hypothetical protein
VTPTRTSGFVWRPVPAWLLFVASAGLAVLALDHAHLDLADAGFLVGTALGWVGGYLGHEMCRR